MDFDLYKMMIGYDGKTAQERVLNRLHRDIFDLAPDTLSYKSVLINDEPRHLMISSSLDTNVKKIQAMPHETLGVGNHVKYCDKDYWVTACSVDDGVYAYGEMTLCSDIVRFISPYDHKTILEYPTLLTNTTKFNTGETPNKRITLVSGQFSMILPINKHTLCIDNDFRFLLDKRKDYPSAYRVTYVDPSTYGYDDGMLNIILLQCNLNLDTDNIDLMIADYSQLESESPESSIFLDTTSPVVKIGIEKTFYPVLSGDVPTPLNFDVEMLDEVKPYVSYSTTDTSITFNVQNDMRLVGNFITLNITDANGENEYTALVQIRGVI